MLNKFTQIAARIGSTFVGKTRWCDEVEESSPEPSLQPLIQEL